MTSAGYLRFPHLHGDLLTFVAEDDIWLAPLSGGRGWRLSADGAQAATPRFAPDGRSVAWASWRDGPAEVYLAGVDGERGRRLTYWGEPDVTVGGWTPEGEVLALSATGQPFDRQSWAHAVPPGGGPARRLPFGPVAALALRPGAQALLNGTWGRDPAYWKRYRGGTAGRLWTAVDGGPFRRILAGLSGQLASPMLVGGRLAFLSDHEGTGNVYSCLPDGSDLRRHTDHDGFYARQASTDGRRVIYQCRGELWLLEELAPRSQPRPLAVTLGSASTALAPRLISAEDHLGSLSCDHEGRGSAVEVRGTVHWLTHRDGPARALAVDPAARARLPEVAGRTGQVVWVTDAGGADALEIGPAGGPDLAAGSRPAAPRRLAEGQLGLVMELAAAPDGSAVAVAARDGRLLLVDVASGEVTELAVSGDGEVSGLAWAPDSAWLAWCHPGPPPLSRIRLARLARPAAPAGAAEGSGAAGGAVEGSEHDEAPADEPSGAGEASASGAGTPAGPPEIVDVTDGRFIDSEPVFTADGKYLAFLSARVFDPVYDAHFFDLSFPYGARPYLVPLAASTPSPFGPLASGRLPGSDGKPGPGGDGGPGDAEAPASGDAPRSRAGSGHTGNGPAGGAGRPRDGGPGSGGTGDGQPPPAVEVDLEGLAGRITGVPVAESRYSSLHAVAGGLAWLREPVTGVLGEGAAVPGGEPPRAALERFDLATRKATELAGALDWFAVSGNGEWLVVGDGGEVRVVPAQRKADPDGDDVVRVDLSRARFTADPVRQWQHAFAEAGRFMRHDFWIADLADVDWDGVAGDYRPVLDRIGTSAEFADLLWEVVGELGTSHAYIRPAPGHGGHPDGRVGLLGADLARDEDGTWRVARVLPGESSDPRARSPLEAPGAAVQPGDALLAVDGRPVDPLAGPAPLLAGGAGKPVELTVARPGGPARRVAVVPLASDRRLRYQDWVAGRRRLVRERSGGRAGYLHIPDMMGEGWAHFHRDLRVEMAFDALVVDVRANRGGHVSELVVEKLARRIMGWDMPRWMRPATYPRDAPRGPVVVLADENAGSDGDMVTAAIRMLGLGPVVGARTWGGVIGIGPAFTLADGTAMTVPRYAIWLNGFGWGVENHGVDPDVEVLISPEDWAAGRDSQLETAVQVALDRLAEHPAARPPGQSDRPSRRRPPLPPRG